MKPAATQTDAPSAAPAGAATATAPGNGEPAAAGPATSAPTKAAPASGAVKIARVVRGGANVQPLYPATRLLKGAVLEAEHALAESRRTLEQAEADAQIIRNAATADAERVREEAFKFGAERAAEQVAQMLSNLQTELGGLKQQFAKDVQRLAFKISRVIIGAEFKTHPELIVDFIVKVLERAKMYNKVTLRLRPEDIERVRPHQGELAKHLTFAREVGLTADPDLPPHGVRVETEMGSFDGSIETQLRRLESHLLGGAAAPDSIPDDNPAPGKDGAS